MMNKLKHIVSISAITFLLQVMCGCTSKPMINSSSNVSRNYEKEGYTKAMIINMTGLDGCEYLLQLPSGEKLEPNHLSDEYKKDKLEVWVKFEERKNAASICMAGKMITIIAIEKLK